MMKCKGLFFLWLLATTLSCTNQFKSTIFAAKPDSGPQKMAVPGGFIHKDGADAFAELLKTIRDNLPQALPHYQTAILVNGSKQAAGNLRRLSTLTVDLDKRELVLKVVDPNKDTVRKVPGTYTTRAYVDGTKVWVEQKVEGDRSELDNWKIPVNVEGKELRSSADQFRYMKTGPEADEARQNDLAYNLRERMKLSGYSETPNTQFNFVFGLDLEKRGLYFDREITRASLGETLQDEDPSLDGQEVLFNINIRQAVSAIAPSDQEG